MKCPYCGIHYMDDERECPICGKRPGLLAPKKEKPAPMTAEYPKMEPPRRQRKTHIPHGDRQMQFPYESSAGGGGFVPDRGRRKKKKNTGCLVVFVIILIIIVASLAAPLVIMSAVDDYSSDYSTDDSYDESDSIFVDAEILDVLLPGTWQEDGGDRTITIQEDGSVSWSDGLGTCDADYVDFQYLDLTEENASTYCTDEELETYPIGEYAQYTLYLSDWDSDGDSFDICLYLPTTESVEACTSFDAYDYDAYAYTSFTLVTDDTITENVPAPTDADEQNA